jgi:uncharacterized protein YbjT (DUF2867 family)
MARIITVFGATGAQGGGLARAILADPARRFAVRAVTRRPHSEAARALARAGATIVAADMNDAASVQRAVDGAYGAYCVTSFWDHASPEVELRHAEMLAEAVARAGVAHVIWSTLEDSRRLVPPGTRMPVLDGSYNVPHHDAKGEADRFFLERGVPTTLLYTSLYWENLIVGGMGPQRSGDGTLVIGLPIAARRIPWIAAEDIGRSAFGIFARGRGFVGMTVGIAGQHLSGAELALQLSAALGEPVRYEAVTPEAYRAGGHAARAALANMWVFMRECEALYCAARSVEVTRRLNPAVQSFDAWLATNAPCIPVPPLAAAA